MICYSLESEDIVGDKFKGFIEKLLSQSDFFSLTVQEDNGNTLKEKLEMEISKHIIKNFETRLWYAYKTMGNPLGITIYKSDVELVDSIMTLFSTLFSPKIYGIEDICFFKRERIVLGSVSHENIAQLFLDSEFDIEEYKEFANWSFYKMRASDYEYIPDMNNFVDL